MRALQGQQLAPLAATLGMHLRLGLWCHLQAQGMGPAVVKQVVEEVFSWPEWLAPLAPLPQWPSVQRLWQRLTLDRLIPPRDQHDSQPVLFQLAAQLGVRTTAVDALRWHARVQQALRCWEQSQQENSAGDWELPWLYATGDGFRELPSQGHTWLLPKPSEDPQLLLVWKPWPQRLQWALTRWEQGDQGGEVSRELIVGWADAQRRSPNLWAPEHRQLFDRVHRLLDGTRPWELLPRASACLRPESWRSHWEELQHMLLWAQEPSPEDILRRAWHLWCEVDQAELVLYAAMRLARINSQLADIIRTWRLRTWQQPQWWAPAAPLIFQQAQELDFALGQRDYELGQTLVKFQVLKDHLRLIQWQLSFGEPLPQEQ